MSEQNENNFSLLCEISSDLAQEYKRKKEQKRKNWEGSYFNWLHDESSRTKGAIFEKLIEGYLMQKGFSVQKSGNSEFDRYVNKVSVEIKGSTLWENNLYKFQQIRNQSYQLLICIGVSPHRAHFWAIPKRDLMSNDSGFRTDLEGFEPQHSGKAEKLKENKDKDTFWITGLDPQNPYSWLGRYGGNLENSIENLNIAMRAIEN